MAELHTPLAQQKTRDFEPQNTPPWLVLAYLLALLLALPPLALL